MKLNLVPLILAILLFCFSGCVNKKIAAARNLVECEYTFHSISQVTLDGMDFSKRANVQMIPRVLSLLTNPPDSLPLSVTVNLNVTNPTRDRAAIEGLDYILQIDNIEFTRGSLLQSINVAPGRTDVFPVRMDFDLATLLSQSSKEAVEEILMNFLEAGNEEAKVSLQIKPFLHIAGRTVSQDHYIPVNFRFKNK